MTINPQHKTPQTGEYMSLQEYFQLDYTFPSEKYEYHNGVIRLMSGGSIAHDDIAFNIRAALKELFQSGPCSVQGSDVRVQVNSESYFFPDVTVTCDVADRRPDNKLIRSPRLVVEVLSPSTEKFDRGKKLSAYQSCPSIAEIVLVDQFVPRVESWCRDQEDETLWRYVQYTGDAVVEFASLDAQVPMHDIYHNISFDRPRIQEE